MGEHGGKPENFSLKPTNSTMFSLQLSYLKNLGQVVAQRTKMVTLQHLLYQFYTLNTIVVLSMEKFFQSKIVKTIT